MRFSPVPEESKRAITRAGIILTQDSPNPEDLLQARELAERWRACHAYPINTFQSNLRTKLKNYPRSPLAAQRLKRMPTIISKLKLYPKMELTTMQDIGGVRAIMGNIADAYKLADEFRNGRLKHELVNQKDYIESPRSDDGYRGIHLIYKYKNTRVPCYDGLRLELQIRTKMQHAWATAVETMGTIRNEALKSRLGAKEWIDFFALVASAIAYMEDRPPVPRFQHLSPKETFKKVTDADKLLKAIDTMKAYAVLFQHTNTGSNRKHSYHLIIINFDTRRIRVKPYDSDSLEKAVIDYGKVEAVAEKGMRIEAVLVAAGPISSLRRAYPNLFINIDEFIKILNRIERKTRQ